MFLELPEKVDQQAEWEFELALAALEGGLPPDVAADHFQTALKLEPDLDRPPGDRLLPGEARQARPAPDVRGPQADTDDLYTRAVDSEAGFAGESVRARSSQAGRTSERLTADRRPWESHTESPGSIALGPGLLCRPENRHAPG